MDVVSGIVFSNRAPERRSKSAEKNSATQTKTVRVVLLFAMKLLDGILQGLAGLEGRHLRRGDLDGLAGVGIAAPTGAAPIFSNYVTPSQ
jgi:hypothetical protein